MLIQVKRSAGASRESPVVTIRTLLVMMVVPKLADKVRMS